MSGGLLFKKKILGWPKYAEQKFCNNYVEENIRIILGSK